MIQTYNKVGELLAWFMRFLILSRMGYGALRIAYRSCVKLNRD